MRYIGTARDQSETLASKTTLCDNCHVSRGSLPLGTPWCCTLFGEEARACTIETVETHAAHPNAQPCFTALHWLASDHSLRYGPATAGLRPWHSATLRFQNFPVEKASRVGTIQPKKTRNRTCARKPKGLEETGLHNQDCRRDTRMICNTAA